MTDEELRGVFEPYGIIVDLHVMRKSVGSNSGERRGGRWHCSPVGLGWAAFARDGVA